MICFECGENQLTPAEVLITGTRNEEQFEILTHGYQCGTCGAKTIDSNQNSEFTQKLSDAYRAAHGLLTGPEIRALRKSLGMSSQAFADYLRVGVASIKRWEVGQVQDKAMDELIRVKADIAYARQSLENLAFHVPKKTVVEIVEGTQFSFVSEATYSRPRQPMRLDLTGMVWAEDHIDDLLAA